MERTLFYVDDDSDDLAMFLYAAKSLNVNVQLFQTADQLRDNLHDAPKDLAALVVDLNLPNIDGYEIISTLTADANFSIPIIAFTTASDDRSVQKARQAGATGYIVKPQTISRLKQTIAFMLDFNWHSYMKDKQFYYSESTGKT